MTDSSWEYSPFTSSKDLEIGLHSVTDPSEFNNRLEIMFYEVEQKL